MFFSLNNMTWLIRTRAFFKPYSDQAFFGLPELSWLMPLDIGSFKACISSSVLSVSRFKIIIGLPSSVITGHTALRFYMGYKFYRYILLSRELRKLSCPNINNALVGVSI